ncbi:MAG: von Willebrand factor type A domain-containing protein, partial [Pseudomonadota bacterium]
MTEDAMKRLEAAMKAAPAPRGKAAATDSALRAFDEEFAAAAAAAQEPEGEARRSWWRSIFGSFAMIRFPRTFDRRLTAGGALVATSVAAFMLIDAQTPPTNDPIVEVREELRLSDAGAPSSAAPTTREVPALAPAPQAHRSRDTVVISPLTELDQIAGEASPKAAVRPQPTVAPRDHLVADPPARDRFANADPNPVKRAAEHPVSTFSVDVDTASYAWVRRSLREGRMPAPDAVRVEELVNYFAYDYPAAESAARPFSVSTALVEAPWAEGRLLLRVGLRGYEPPTPTRANYTFLIDTSGSMGAPDKLPLLLTSLRLLVDDLGPDDTVAIVTYAGSSAVALEPTAASEKGAILDALDRLAAGGGTAGAAGIETAYRLAEDRFDSDAVNRVILATDGDFNIGAASPDAMETLIEAKRRSGV